jgi:hypothetical protein
MSGETETTTRARGRATAKKSPATRAADAIRAGTWDRELEAVARALGDRVRAGAISMRWYVELDELGRVVEDDITIGEAFEFELETRRSDPDGIGSSWAELDPLGSAAHARAVLVVLYSTRLGLTRDAALDRVRALTLEEFTTAYGKEAVAKNPTMDRAS